MAIVSVVDPATGELKYSGHEKNDKVAALVATGLVLVRELQPSEFHLWKDGGWLLDQALADAAAALEAEAPPMTAEDVWRVLAAKNLVTPGDVPPGRRPPPRGETP